MPWFNEKNYGAAEREALDQVTTTQQTLEGAETGALGRLKDQLQKIQTLRHQTDLYEKSLIADAKQNVSANRSDYEADKAPLQNVFSSQSLKFDDQKQTRLQGGVLKHLRDESVSAVSV